MNGSRPFTFHGNLQSPSIHNAYSLPQGQDQQTGGGSRKRKSSYEDISPLVMKTRTGIGLEQEIVYDRTMTLMMEGQRRLLSEQKQRQHQQHSLQQLHQGEHEQQQLALRQQHNPKESSTEAMRRLFAFGRTQQQQQHSSPTTSQPVPAQQHLHSLHQHFQPSEMTFAECAGEINGCETNRVPGMRDRYQALIQPCSFCQRPQCQFCAINCASCQELSCRACCTASYDRPEVEYYCIGCRG